MKVLTYCLAVLLISIPLKTDARVIGSDYINDIVAVYYFNSETESIVTDYGSNEVHGLLLEDASLTNGKYGKCLSLPATDDEFGAFHNDAFIGSLNAFSIVAWVKIPNQTNDFNLTAYASNPGIPDSVLIGAARLRVKADGNLSAVYADIEDEKVLTIETTGKNVSNNRWHHIAFTVSGAKMHLYLNGESVKDKDVTGYTSFLADQTLISIGSDAKGSVDDAGFFDDTFSEAHIDLIYDVGLEKLISIASTEPDAKLTTTWGALKSRR